MTKLNGLQQHLQITKTVNSKKIKDYFQIFA